MSTPMTLHADRFDVNTVDMNTPRRRPTYHHGDLPEALLAASELLIAERGVEAFSLREAARRVGVDPAACYRHFRDRDGVIFALARRGFTRLATRMERIVAKEANAETAPRAFARAYVRFAVQRPSDFRVMFGPKALPPRSARVRGEYERGPFDILVKTVSIWRGRGPDEKPTGVDERTAMGLWAIAHGVANLTADGAWGLDRRAAERVLDDLLDQLLRDPAEWHGAR